MFSPQNKIFSTAFCLLHCVQRAPSLFVHTCTDNVMGSEVTSNLTGELLVFIDRTGASHIFVLVRLDLRAST